MLSRRQTLEHETKVGVPNRNTIALQKISEQEAVGEEGDSKSLKLTRRREIKRKNGSSDVHLLRQRNMIYTSRA